MTTTTDVQHAVAAQLDQPGAAAGSAPPPRVLGLDMSLTATGLSDGRDVWLIKSKGAKTATLSERRTRLARLRDGINESCLGAGLIVVEQPAFSRTTGHMHDRSGLWWLVVDALADFTVVEVSPTSLKTYATGKGNASKDQVLAAVVRRYPGVDVGDNNEADALVLAAMGLRHLGHPIDDLPLTHLRAMAKVAWPARAGDEVPSW